MTKKHIFVFACIGFVFAVFIVAVIGIVRIGEDIVSIPASDVSKSSVARGNKYHAQKLTIFDILKNWQSIANSLSVPSENDLINASIFKKRDEKVEESDKPVQVYGSDSFMSDDHFPRAEYFINHCNSWDCVNTSSSNDFSWLNMSHMPVEVPFENIPLEENVFDQQPVNLESGYSEDLGFMKAETPCNQYFLSLRRNQGEIVGCRTSYTTLEALTFPFHYRTIWPFLDFRAHYFDEHDDYAANVGLGVRIEPTCINQVFGMNVYYDCRHAHRFHYNQLGLGFEILGTCWNFRLNGYLPVGNTSALNSCCLFNKFDGDFFMLRENFVDSIKGVNFELESLLAETCWVDIYLAIGGYCYSGKGCKKNIYGSEYRITADICEYLSFKVTATHDDVYKTRVQAQVSLTVPLYFQKKQACYCQWKCDTRVFQPVERHEIIVLKERSRWTWNW